MRPSKNVKARRRLERELQLRTKRYKGDHDYQLKVVRAGGFRVLPYPVWIEPVPLGCTAARSPRSRCRAHRDRAAAVVPRR